MPVSFKKQTKNKEQALGQTEDGIYIPSIEEVKTERSRLKHNKLFLKITISTVATLVVVAAVSVLIVTLLMPSVKVIGNSMEPTLYEDDVLILSKTNNFSTGDLCAVRVSGNILLKRMIAGPGDWVDIDNDGNVSVNGELIDEPYVTGKALGKSDIKYPYQVPAGRIFVMGDHRNVSIDSRTKEVGCIPYDQVMGKVMFRVWPITRISFVS